MDRKTALKMLNQIISETQKDTLPVWMERENGPRQRKPERQTFTTIRELARDLAGMIRTDKSITD